MSKLFSTHNPVIHCAPKPVRRRWLRVALLLMLSGLVVWLLSGCHADSSSFLVLGSWWKATAGVSFIVGSALGIVWAVRWVRDGERFCEELRQKQAASKAQRLRTRRQFWEDCTRPHDVPALSEPMQKRRVPFCQRGCEWECTCTDDMLGWTEEAIPGPAQAGTTNEVDPLALPAKGLDVAELIEIHGALALVLCEAREMVRKAKKDGSVEDYGDRLAGAERRIGEAIACVGGLIERGMRATAQEAAVAV